MSLLKCFGTLNTLTGANLIMRDFIKFQWFLLIGYILINVAFAEPEAPENSTSPIKVISSGDQSLSLDQQLHNVTPPVPEAEEIQSIPSELEHAEHLNLPESVGSHSNEIKITQLQQELQTAFQKADQAATGFSKAEQFSLYLLYKQAEQNQLLLAQNNELISTLRQIKSQNHAIIELLQSNKQNTEAIKKH